MLHTQSSNEPEATQWKTLSQTLRCKLHAGFTLEPLPLRNKINSRTYFTWWQKQDTDILHLQMWSEEPAHQHYGLLKISRQFLQLWVLINIFLEDLIRTMSMCTSGTNAFQSDLRIKCLPGCKPVLWQSTLPKISKTSHQNLIHLVEVLFSVALLKDLGFSESSAFA